MVAQRGLPNPRCKRHTVEKGRDLSIPGQQTERHDIVKIVKPENTKVLAVWRASGFVVELERNVKLCVDSTDEGNDVRKPALTFSSDAGL